MVKTPWLTERCRGEGNENDRLLCSGGDFRDELGLSVGKCDILGVVLLVGPGEVRAATCMGGPLDLSDTGGPDKVKEKALGRELSPHSPNGEDNLIRSLGCLDSGGNARGVARKHGWHTKSSRYRSRGVLGHCIAYCPVIAAAWCAWPVVRHVRFREVSVRANDGNSLRGCREGQGATRVLEHRRGLHRAIVCEGEGVIGANVTHRELLERSDLRSQREISNNVR